jgi:hypothetical protein
VAPRRAHGGPVRLSGGQDREGQRHRRPDPSGTGHRHGHVDPAQERSGAICTLSLSFNNDGPLGTFFRYIGDTATYIARYDDLVNGKEEPIDVSKVAVSMNGIELQDREFAAIREGREPNSSVARCSIAIACWANWKAARAGWSYAFPGPLRRLVAGLSVAMLTIVVFFPVGGGRRRRMRDGSAHRLFGPPLRSPALLRQCARAGRGGYRPGAHALHDARAGTAIDVRFPWSPSQRRSDFADEQVVSLHMHEIVELVRLTGRSRPRRQPGPAALQRTVGPGRQPRQFHAGALRAYRHFGRDRRAVRRTGRRAAVPLRALQRVARDLSPPQDVPLALCDARTLADDLIEADAVFDEEGKPEWSFEGLVVGQRASLALFPRADAR